MATNRVVIGPIRAILGAQKAMFLGYMLGQFRALGRPKKSPKIAPESFPRQWEKSSNILCLCAFLPLENYELMGILTTTAPDPCESGGKKAHKHHMFDDVSHCLGKLSGAIFVTFLGFPRARNQPNM